MVEQKTNKENKKKGFFSSLIEKLDKKMEEKSKKSPCCGSDKGKGSSCC